MERRERKEKRKKKITVSLVVGNFVVFSHKWFQVLLQLQWVFQFEPAGSLQFLLS